MNFDPRLHEMGLGGRNFAIEDTSVQYGEGSLPSLIFGMNVRQLMPFVIKKIKADDDAIK